MKRASHRLASETPSVTDIAMDAGFGKGSDSPFIVPEVSRLGTVA